MKADKYSPVGFFDSGVGGITVLDEAMRLLPRENYLYLADCSHAPYGSRPRGEILDRARFCVQTLADAGAKAAVIACNTATAVAIETVRQEFDMPVIGAEPAIKPACDVCGDRPVLVLVTPLTAAEPRLMRLIARFPDKNILVAPLDGLATAVEKHIDALYALRTDVYRRLSAYPEPGAVVLGCTHYVHIKTLISDYYGGRVPVVDGNRGIALRLKAELTSAGMLNDSGGHVRFVSV